MLTERRERNLRGRRVGRYPLRGGNADEPQTLPMAPSERLDRVGRSRATPEPDHHAILNQVHSGLGGRVLESVQLGAGNEICCAHGHAPAAAALARMAAM